MPSGNTFILEVHPKIPRRLARLEELADNLWYSWDRPTRSLFSRLHTSLWDAVGHSPKAFLKRVDEQRLIAAADDPVFLNSYNRVLSAYDSYKDEPLRRNGSEWLRQNDLIAYFCAEFGFHESLPIYSGGLGILAGDHCKAASDMPGCPSSPSACCTGRAISRRSSMAMATSTRRTPLRISPIFRSRRSRGGMAPRCSSRWTFRDGRSACTSGARRSGMSRSICSIPTCRNVAPDRAITHRLYGGDEVDRIEQEIVLGIGGVRALRRSRVCSPTVGTSTKAMRRSSCSSACREWVVKGDGLSAAWSGSRPTRCSPPTRQCRRDATTSRWT